MRLRSHLVESMIDVNQADIDRIWEPVKKQSQIIAKEFEKPEQLSPGKIKRVIKDILSMKHSEHRGQVVFYKPTGVINSKELKSPLIKIASKMNPVTILSGFIGGHQGYYPEDGVIVVGIPMDILMSIDTAKKIKDMREIDALDAVRGILSFYDIRSQIRHELTHWLDDTLHNRHILDKSQRGKLTMTGHEGAKFELNAIVHQIAQIKRDITAYIEKENPERIVPWRKMDFDDLTFMIPELRWGLMHGQVDGKELIKRMWREKLLTKKMIASLQKNIKKNLKK